MSRLDEAIEIIRELRQAMYSGMCCDERDFLGEKLYNKIRVFFGESLDDEDDEDEEDEDEE